jgi:hypothetical protein
MGANHTQIHSKVILAAFWADVGLKSHYAIVRDLGALVKMKRRTISLNTRYDAVDLAHVRWHEVDAIVKPQVYEIVGGTGSANFFWGHLIYDRVHKRAYTYVNGGD